eukprot:405020_1
MIQMLIVLFSVYTTFGSRLLLQTNNAWVPITPGVEPIPPFVKPYVPAEPQAPVDPVPAVPAGPVVPAVPVVPTVPQSPQYVPIDPAQPAQPGQPVIPHYVLPPVAPTKTECKESPPHPSSCAGTIQTINNPSENWELLCDGVRGCAATQFNVNFGPNANPMMESMKGFWFVNEFAAAGAIININNQRPGDKIMIDEITCDKPGSCLNTQFIIGTMMELDIGNFYCAPQACGGCVVKESLIDPGLPCTAYADPI